MSEPTIRPMTMADYAEAYRLWAQADGICLGDEDAPGAIEIYLRRNEGLCFVACDGDRIVGIVLCGNDGRRGILRHLVVVPQYRRQGVARELIRHCLEALARAGIGKCNAFVMDDNLSGRRFWEHMGWRTIAYDYRTMQMDTGMLSNGAPTLASATSHRRADETGGDIRIVARGPTAAEFRSLRTDAGWGVPSQAAIEEGLRRSLFAVCAELPTGETAGMARIVGDGAVQLFITDVIVLRAWQNRGVGSRMMDGLMRWVQTNAGPATFVGLFSAYARETFYQRFGFITRPNQRLGAGMMYLAASASPMLAEAAP